MSYYVLRQIMPSGKSARADEATLVALTIATLKDEVVLGPYLVSSDPDAFDGRGYDSWSYDLAKAKHFATFSDAMTCWKAQSTVRPWRPDGKANRPMTAYSVEPQRIEE